MIQINFENGTYICPFCGHAQVYTNTYDFVDNGYFKRTTPIPECFHENSFRIYTMRCNNSDCGRISVTAINRTSGKQIDLVPQVVMKQYPDYIPEQIRKDYEEANLIIESSPKAAATLLRRCLQGMIRDYWGICKDTLNKEIIELEGKVTPAQWNAIDALRKLGNIGAHMEKDVNMIVDIDIDEAWKLLKLIELLLEKWYISRHDEEELLAGITDIADEKDAMRKEK